MRKLVLLFVAAATLASCSAGKRAIKENGAELRKQTSIFLTTDKNSKYIEVGGMGTSKTDPIAIDIAELNARARAAQELATMMIASRNQEDTSNLSAEGVTTEIEAGYDYGAEIASKAKSLLANASTTKVYVGDKMDGSGNVIALVRIRVPYDRDKDFVSVSLMEEAKVQ